MLKIASHIAYIPETKFLHSDYFMLCKKVDENDILEIPEMLINNHVHNSTDDGNQSKMDNCSDIYMK